MRKRIAAFSQEELVVMSADELSCLLAEWGVHDDVDVNIPDNVLDGDAAEGIRKALLIATALAHVELVRQQLQKEKENADQAASATL